MLRNLLVCSAVALTLAQPTPPQPLPEPPPGDAAAQHCRPQWWFPSTMPVGSRYDYHATYEVQGPDYDRSGRLAHEADFALAVGQEPGKPGRVVSLVLPDAAGAEASQLTTWLTGLAGVVPDGVRVTSDGVFLRGAPLLRGPWREGDRLTFGGAVFFFTTFVSVAHGQVVSADSAHVRLDCDIWGGVLIQPQATGDAELYLASDECGLLSLELEWAWTYCDAGWRGRIHVSRTGITEAQPPPPESASAARQVNPPSAEPPALRGSDSLHGLGAAGAASRSAPHSGQRSVSSASPFSQ